MMYKNRYENNTELTNEKLRRDDVSPSRGVI